MNGVQLGMQLWWGSTIAQLQYLLIILVIGLIVAAIIGVIYFIYMIIDEKLHPNRHRSSRFNRRRGFKR